MPDKRSKVSSSASSSSSCLTDPGALQHALNSSQHTSALDPTCQPKERRFTRVQLYCSGQGSGRLTTTWSAGIPAKCSQECLPVAQKGDNSSLQFAVFVCNFCRRDDASSPVPALSRTVSPPPPPIYGLSFWSHLRGLSACLSPSLSPHSHSLPLSAGVSFSVLASARISWYFS